MAFHSLQYLGFLTRCSRASYPLYSVTSLSCSFSSSSVKNLDECKVLDELSDLLPIRHITLISNVSIPKSSPQNQFHISAAGHFVPPLEDKLRGVFLQKLKGKTAIENALTSSVTSTTELTLDVVAEVVNRGNLGGEAMATFFSWAIKQPNINVDLSTYHVILKALGRRKFFDFMLEKLQDMCAKGVSPTCETLGIVLDSFIRARRLSKAIEMFGKLEDFGVKADTDCFNMLLQCLCRRGHVGKANSLLNSMKEKIEFNSMTYNIVISGWAKLGKVSEMENLLKGMVEDGFSAENLTYGYLIEGLGRAGQIDDAVKIFKSMEKEGFMYHACVYNAMIGNYISVGDFDECKRYFEQMLSNDCPPNMDTYVRLISALLKARKVADALEMFDEMLCRGIVPSTGTVTSFIEPLCSYGPPHAAMIIYKNAKGAGCTISMSAYKLLLMRLSRFGKCGMLVKLWEEMQESGYTSDMEVYEYVINGLCNNGQLESATLVLEECLREGFCPSRLIFGKLSNKLLASNKTEHAYKLFLKIREARFAENAKKYWRANGWHF
ncbi:hypothetical protein Ancab_008238 [Ancistrocladus abbreviatus]